MMNSEVQIRRAAPPSGALEEFSLGDTYFLWQQREGARVIRDFAFEDLAKVELTPWERKGGYGAIISIPYYHVRNDAHIVEISAGSKSEPEHHMYEETTYIISGRGATTIWHDESKKQTFEWHAGSLFAIPLNAWYQHFNASGAEPARYLSMTNAPPMMRLFQDLDFIFDTPFMFKSRYSDDGDYFSGNGKLYDKRVWASNFIPNAPDMGLYNYEQRGADGIQVVLKMARNNIKAHISEFPVGTYKKAHRHGPGAHLLILSGQGFSQLWTEGAEYRKYDWRKGGMVIVPSDECFHQHFNTGPVRARYLALHSGDMGLVLPGARSNRRADDPQHQIEYQDEDREIHELFEAELRQNGAPCRMKAFIPWCSGEVGPTDERGT